MVIGFYCSEWSSSLNYLNHLLIQAAYRRWIKPYAEPAIALLDRIKCQAEEQKPLNLRCPEGKIKMKEKSKQTNRVVDGAKCTVVGGTHKGKAGTVRDINTSKTGQITITVVQPNGELFKTLAKNVEVQ